MAETWWRDLGAEDARALMRAQNEPGELAVRLVRGEIDGRADRRSRRVARRRVDAAALAEGRIWPQSRASQLVGLAVGAREGERTLDLCAAPGGKATMLAGEVVAVDVNEARARELEETSRRLGASNVRVVVGRRPRRSRPSSTASTARSWTLPARASASSTGAPTCAGAPSRFRSSSSSSCGRPPSV